MNFKRSPSKVWWGSESLEYREASSSPGSQDSGFSDTETSPQNTGKNKKSDQEKEASKQNETINQAPISKIQLAKNIFKDGDPNPVPNDDNPNLISNYKEKSTPTKKNIDQRLAKSDRKDSPHFLKKFFAQSAATEPAKRQRFIKHSPKVSRNLFANKNAKECPDTNPNQYSKLTLSANGEPTIIVEPEENISLASEERYIDTSSEISGTKSLPIDKNDSNLLIRLVKSAPDINDNSQSSDLQRNSSSSECESELENIFEELGGPEHTSTPKCGKMRHRKRERTRFLGTKKFDHQSQDRVPPISADGTAVDNKAVLCWLEEARLNLEQECTTTLQFKSISAELNEKVGHLAACSTTILRGLLSHSRCIEMDYKHLNSESKHVDPLIQSLAGNIFDFLKAHVSQVSAHTVKVYEQVRAAQSERALKPLSELFNQWQTVQNKVLVSEIKKLVAKLEEPTSDMDLRATLTGITSVTLRNTDLIDHFVKADVIPILLILCERCDGSSVRTLILRALSTMCTDSSAVRYFEKFSGVQIIADTLEEESRPEPERSEAVALLAQVTAPWLEDNHSIKGLQEYSKKLISSLAKFASNTKCCQNLLLCSAALANLSSMDSKSIGHFVDLKVAPILLEAIKIRGPLANVCLLEQVATLLANMAAAEVARSQLIEAEASVALLYFLSSSRIAQNEDVERRLQQKSVIALSRLCGDLRAANQVVDNGGVEKLVRLCREKRERFNSDAVLVAALATLRKIADACGKSILKVQDCQELVEPKLLESFLAYSTQNESYV